MQTTSEEYINLTTIRLERALSTKQFWALVVFLFVVFAFVTPYEFDYSIRDNDVAEAMSASQDGSPGRRLVMPLLGIFGIVVIFGNKLRRRLALNGALGVLFYCYLGFSFCSIAWAEEPLLALRKLVVLFLFILGAVSIAACFSMREILIYMAFTCGGAMILALGAELYHGTFLQAKAYSIYQLSGIMHPNALSCYISCYILAIITLMCQNRYKYQVPYLILVAIGFAFLYLAKSRTAFFCTVLVGFMIWLPSSTMSRRLTGFLGAAVLVCSLGLIFQDTFAVKMNSVVFMGRESEEGASTLTNRTPLWNECMTYVEKKPWLGYGYDAFWTPYRIYLISQHQGWSVPHSHNGYIELLLSLGVVGLTLYLGTILILIKRVLKFYFKTRDVVHLFAFGMIVWLSFEMMLEKVYMNPVFPSFVCNLVIARYAFVEDQEFKLVIQGEEEDEIIGVLEATC